MDTDRWQAITHVVQQVETTWSCTFRNLQVMQGLVFTPADHFPHSVHVTCPFTFHEFLDLTFLDTMIFRQCTMDISSILANLKSRFQSAPKWSRRYSWGCKSPASLLVARILPRPSKGFTHYCLLSMLAFTVDCPFGKRSISDHLEPSACWLKEWLPPCSLLGLLCFAYWGLWEIGNIFFQVLR